MKNRFLPPGKNLYLIQPVMKSRTIQFLFSGLLTTIVLWCCAAAVTVDARQTPDVQIELSLLPVLSEAQTLSLAQLGIDTRGSGNRLFNMIIENREFADEFYNDQNKLEGLYLSASVRVSGVGKIIRLESDASFSMRRNQVIIANNNSLQDGLPGVDENVRGKGDLTPEGEEFINSLKGSTRLPDMVYTISLELWYGGKRGQGVLISESMVTLPVESLSDDFDIVLIQPGEAAGSEPDPLFSRYPVFRWDGDPRAVYRLIVVQAREGQSPESLIQASLGSDPSIIPSGINLPFTVGSLLEAEMVDAIVRGLAFNFPVGGNVQQLQPNERYFWQVFGVQRTPSGVEYQPSEVFEFSIGEQQRQATTEAVAIPTIVRALIGQEETQRLTDGGFTLQSAMLDGTFLPESQLEQLINQLCEGDTSELDPRIQRLCNETIR